MEKNLLALECKLDNFGRLVIPASFRKVLGWQPATVRAKEAPVRIELDLVSKEIRMTNPQNTD